MSAQSSLLIAYDGECPFCSSYVHILRLRATIKEVKLIDARSDDPFIKEIGDLGINLDQGMVVKYIGRYYYGADAINILSLLSSNSGLWNRIIAYLFRYSLIAKILYPVMVFFRKITLKVLGKKPITN